MRHTTGPLEIRFRNGLTFDEMLASATSNQELYAGIRARAAAPPEFVERIAATGRHWHLLVISEDWCGDAVNIVPFVDALGVASEDVEMRLVARDEHPELMDAHLTNGTLRSIPIVLVLDDRFEERDWWGPRPRALQEWFYTPEAQALGKDDRYRELRRWYARDRGRTTLHELTEMIERAAAQDAAADSATLRAAS
jgi:hypothetical protein